MHYVDEKKKHLSTTEKPLYLQLYGTERYTRDRQLDCSAKNEKEWIYDGCGSNQTLCDNEQDGELNVLD